MPKLFLLNPNIMITITSTTQRSGPKNLKAIEFEWERSEPYYTSTKQGNKIIHGKSKPQIQPKEGNNTRK
jgi:hypothetical protein